MSDVVERLNEALAGRYAIESELGEGGMATVYLAHDVRHDRHVALKVLRPELAAVVGAERFLSEIKTTANLQHPHILPLFDSGEADSFLFYVMPYVEGEALREKLDRERQLPVGEAVALTRKVASALQYAHEQGVIHRDIKPANILMSRGEPLVADFGIALAVSQAGGGRITETGLSLGTPHYMSPEQASGERTLDPRSDVYALGCVLYEALAGEPPYGGPTAQSVLAKILTAEPRRVSELRRSVDAHVDAAVTRALEKLPADRFASAEEFADALDDPSFRHEPRMQGVATGSRPVATAGEPSGWKERWPTMLALLVVGALLATGVTSILPSADGTDGAVADVPVTRFAMDFGEHPVRDGMLDLSADGGTLVFASEVNGPLYLRNMDDLAIRPLPGTERAQFPAFSPNGKWIAFATPDALLKVAVTGGGGALRIAALPEPLFGIHWGDDGSLVFAMSDGIYRVPEQGGEPIRILEGPGFQLRFPYLLPGGESMVFSRIPLGQAAGTIELLDIASGELTTLVEEGTEARYVEPGYLVYGHPSQALFTATFDPGTKELQGQPFPVLDGVRVVPGYGGLAFRTSENGSAVYLSGGSEGTETLMVLADSSGRREILPLPPGGSAVPALSPDGRKLAYASMDDLQVFVYDFVLGTNTQMTFDGGNVWPIWSPGGDSLLFTSFPEDGDGDGDIYWIPASGAEEPRVLLAGPDVGSPSSFSPDGRYLLSVTFTPGQNTNLQVVELGETNEARPYLEAGWEESAGAISPDGAWAAYQSDEQGSHEIYVRAFPRPAAKIKVSEGGGIQPRWSPDGDRLYYFRGDTLMAAEVRTDPTFQVRSHSQALVVDGYDQSGYDVRPDGDGFVVATRPAGADTEEGEESEPARLIGVVNWLEELRQRAGGGGG